MEESSSESLKFAKSKIKAKGYIFDRYVGKNTYRAKCDYPTGTRYLYFKLINCEICKGRYLKSKWSNAESHIKCSIGKYNESRWKKE